MSNLTPPWFGYITLTLNMIASQQLESDRIKLKLNEEQNIEANEGIVNLKFCRKQYVCFIPLSLLGSHQRSIV